MSGYGFAYFRWRGQLTPFLNDEMRHGRDCASCIFNRGRMFVSFAQLQRYETFCANQAAKYKNLVLVGGEL